MRLIRITVCALAMGAFTVSCADQPTGVEDVGSPLFKKGNGGGACVLPPDGLTASLAGSAAYPRLTLCAWHVGAAADGSWNLRAPYAGQVLELVPPAGPPTDPWCVRVDYSGVPGDSLDGNNAFLWIRDVPGGKGKGRNQSLDQIATRRVDAEGASCSVYDPPPIENCPGDDPDWLGLQCFVDVWKGDYEGVVY